MSHSEQQHATPSTGKDKEDRQYHANVALEERRPAQAPGTYANLTPSEIAELQAPSQQKPVLPPTPQGASIEKVVQTPKGFLITYQFNKPSDYAAYLYSELPASTQAKVSQKAFVQTYLSNISEPGAVDVFSAMAAPVFIGVELSNPATAPIVGFNILAGMGVAQGVSLAFSHRGLSPSQLETQGAIAGAATIGIGAAMPIGTALIPEGVQEAASNLIQPVKDLLPSFRGSWLDQFLYENLPGYAKATGGLARGLVSESVTSPVYGAPEVENEFFDFATGKGSSLLQTFKAEEPEVEPFLPKFLAWGKSPIIGPMAIEFTSQYENVYKAMPSDYLTGLEKPKALSLSDLLSSTRGETSLPRLMQLPKTVGETLLPSLASLPETETPITLGFGILTGFSVGLEKPSRSKVSAYSITELLQEPGAKAGTNPLSVLGVAPSIITGTTTTQATQQSLIQQQTSVQNLVALAVGELPRRKDMALFPFTFKTPTKTVGVGRYKRAYPMATPKEMRKFIGA
jgi:hypothetical protein